MSQRRRSSEHWSEADFRAVFLAYYERIVGVLMRFLGDRGQAEELANDAFWRLYRQPGLEGNGNANLGGWLYRTATNLGLDALRASGRRRRYEGQSADEIRRRAPPAGPLDDLLRRETGERVRTALASIKPAQAQLLVLRASGLSYRELAEALELTLSGVGTTLNRAEAEFRRAYVELYPKG
jgi:RNA polymerase sigma-70 factor (ECF subfamily)